MTGPGIVNIIPSMVEKKIRHTLSAALFLLCGCHGLLPAALEYGAPVDYGEEKHPGIDFDVDEGTPIISAMDGKVVEIFDNHE